MRRAQKVLLGLVLLLVVGGVVFNFVRPVRPDSGTECTGWGGASKWLLVDGPNGRDRAAKLGTATDDLYRRDVLNPCDNKAHSNLAHSWQGPVLILVVGLAAVWGIGRFSPKPPESDDEPPSSTPAPRLPESPPTEWPDGSSPSLFSSGHPQSGP